MNTLEIKKILKKIKCSTDVFCLDALPTQIHRKPFGIILNTDRCHEPGEHWVAIWLSQDETGEYFDSFGFPPLLPEISTFLDNICANGWIYNCVQIQSYSASTCGLYSISYLQNKCNGKSLNEFISVYSQSPEDNDLKISNMFIEV